MSVRHPNHRRAFRPRERRCASPALASDAIGARGRSAWVAEEGDFLVGRNPTWFKSFIWAEVLLQVPACLVLAYGWAAEREWVRMPSIMYSVHVLTTMIPILTTLIVEGAGANPPPSTMCLRMYSVWVALPLLVLSRCLFSGPRLFTKVKAA